MSHFLVGVIIPKDTPNVLSYIDEVMEPYSENNEVEEYTDEQGEKSTYNPDSKWDWFRVGGRWDGVISKTGKERPSEDNGFNHGNGHEEVENNSCLVRQLPVKSAPFAIVTSDGEWHEQGEMGWWGMTRNEKTEPKWHKILQEVFEEYKDHLIVGLDCHI